MKRILVILALFATSVVAIKMQLSECQLQPQIFPAPVFDAGENLSFKGCGTWDENENALPPWRAKIASPSGDECSGILFSPTSIITCCNLGKLFAAMEDKSGFKAYLGSCNDRSVDKCTQNGKGKVSQVFAVDVFPIGAGVTLWKIESVAFVPNWISPLCIFNKDNQIRPGQNYSVHSTSWDSRLKAELVSDVKSCLRTEITPEDCFWAKTSVCVQYPKVLDWNTFYYLLNFENNRYFFRGAYIISGKENHELFMDALPYVNQLVPKSSDVFVMPEIPTPKNRTNFN